MMNVSFSSFKHTASESIKRYSNYQKEVFTNLSNTVDKKSKICWGVCYGMGAIAAGVALSAIVTSLGHHQPTIIDILKKDIIYIDPSLPKFASASTILGLMQRITYPFALAFFLPLPVIIIPTIEELVYRELVQNEILHKKLKPLLDTYCPKLSHSPTVMKIIRIVGSATLFSLHHAPDFWMRLKSGGTLVVMLPYYFGMGLAFAAAREHKDVFTSIAAHATLNFTVIAAQQVAIIAYLFFNHRF